MRPLDPYHRMLGVLRAVPQRDATVERAREIEALIGIEFPDDERFEELRTAVALFSQYPDPQLVNSEGLSRICGWVLEDLGDV